jgi:hypothetical protein
MVFSVPIYRVNFGFFSLAPGRLLRFSKFSAMKEADGEIERITIRPNTCFRKITLLFAATTAARTA